MVQDNLSYIKQRSSDNIEFEITIPEQLKAQLNPHLMGWVLENLLKNAVNAIKQEGKVSIRGGKEGNTVYLEVSDTGTGISKSKFKTIFKQGYTTRKRGWGLGLTLSKRIVEQYHRGNIYVKNSSAAGTTFRIELQSAD